MGIKSADLRTSSGTHEFQFLIFTKMRSRSLYRESQTYRGHPRYQDGGRGCPRICRAVNWHAIFSIMSWTVVPTRGHPWLTLLRPIVPMLSTPLDASK